MTLVIWFVLFAIGVSDVQHHRISNQLVGILLLAVLVDMYYVLDILWWLHFKSFLITFAVCFGLYILGAMAAGDVKLLAVVALWLGSDVMSQVATYMILAGGLVGLFYLAFYLASSSISISENFKSYIIQRVTPGMTSGQALVIPFAPAIVIGLAYYFYIH